MAKIAFLFAGQGSQYAGMGKDFYDTFPESKAVFDLSEQALGFELTRVCFEGPQESLKATSISQPAIVATTIAAFEAFRVRVQCKPDYMAGLSLGEYSALIASGVFSLADGVRLIKFRGQIMEASAHKYPGRMTAVVELPIEKIKEICSQTGAEVANLNCPGQTVITGKAEAVGVAQDLCARAGAKRVIPLEVSGGFHSSLMREASVELKNYLSGIKALDAAVPVVSNYTAAVETKAAQIIQNLVSQMHASVRWEESMRFLLSQGVTKFYEFGPGKVLKGLMRRIEPAAEVIAIEKAEDILRVAESIKEA